MKSLVTGGAGFIGSHLVDLLIEKGHDVIVLDALTYAGTKEHLDEAVKTGKCELVVGDISDRSLVFSLLKQHKVEFVYHLAAESHVDNSINDSSAFISTNINGTHALLTAAQEYLAQESPENFKFIHVSTDEVFGNLGPDDEPFTETTAYAPNSPYSASKAASDLLVRAWTRTYKFPAVITNCSNNYGSRQHKEKLIPTIIRNALAETPIPIYGTGGNVRDWLYVKDHCEGIYKASMTGRIGESYCFGGDCELSNLDLAHLICEMIDEFKAKEGNDFVSAASLISFVDDRKGHDWRYAVDYAKAKRELGFAPTPDFKDKLNETVDYYYKLISGVEKGSL